MRGRKNPTAIPVNNNLPACRVCGEPGTGFHYGANTCGACKRYTAERYRSYSPCPSRGYRQGCYDNGFFRRSLTRTDPYLCYKSSLCNVGLSNRRRSICPKCRHEKCLAVGMSRDACKVGRYSHAKKYKDYREVRKDREPTSSTEHETCQSASESVTSSTSEKSNMEDSSHSTRRDCVNRDPIQITLSLSSDEDNDSDSQKEQDSHTMYWANASKTRHEEHSNSMTHSLARSIGHGMRCTGGDTDDTAESISSTSTLNIDSNHGTQSNSFDHSTVFSMNDPKMADGTSYSMPLSSMSYQHSDITTSSFTPVCHLDMDGMKPSETEIKTSTNDHSPSPMRTPSSQPLWQGYYQTLDFLDENNTIAKTIPQNVEKESELLSENTKYSTYNFSSSPIQPTTSQKVSDKLKQTSVHTNYCNHHDNTTSQTTMQPNNTYDQRTISESSHSSLLTPNGQDYNIFLNGNMSNDDVIKTKQLQETDTSETNLSTPHKIIPTKQGHVLTTRDDCIQFIEDRRSEDQMEEKETKCKHSKSDISESISSDMSKTLVPSIENKGDKDLPSLKPLVCPDPMKLIIAAFQQFPYKAFEKQSLAPLLKLCYMENDWVDEYITNDRQTTPGMVTPGVSPFQKNSDLFQTLKHSSLSLREESDDVVYMDNLSEFIQKCHQAGYGQDSTFLSMEEAARDIQVFQKICQLNDTLKGALHFIDDDQYYNIWKTTGFAADKRKEYFHLMCHQGFNDSLTTDVKFYQLLPGFNELCLEDRMNLIKSTYMVVKALFSHRSLDTDCDVLLDPYRGRAIRVSTYKRVFGIPSDFFDKGSLCADAMKSMGITLEERVLLKAYFIMCPELCDNLENRKLVTKWNKIYLKCLVHHIRKTHYHNANERLHKLALLIAFLKETVRFLKQLKVQ